MSDAPDFLTWYLKSDWEYFYGSFVCEVDGKEVTLTAEELYQYYLKNKQV